MKKGKKNLVLLISGLILTLTAISTNVFKNKNNPLSAAADNSTEQIVFDSDHFSLCESTNDIKEGDTIIFSDSYYRENGPKDSDGNFTDDKFINSIITYGLYDLFDYGPTEFQILYNHYFNNSFFPSLAYDAMLRDGNDPMDSLYRGNFVFTAEWVENHLYLKEKYSGYYLNRNIDTDNIFSFVEDPYQFISYDTSGFLTFGVPLAGEQTSVIFGSNGCVVDEPYITSPGINVSYEFPNVKNKTKTLGYEYEYWKIDLFRYKTTSSMTAEDVAEEFNEAMELNCDENGNTSSTNLANIKTAWENATTQYSQLSDEEQEKFFESTVRDSSHFSYEFSSIDGRVEMPLGGYVVCNENETEILKEASYQAAMQETTLQMRAGSQLFMTFDSNKMVQIDGVIHIVGTTKGLKSSGGGGGGGGGGGTTSSSLTVNCTLIFYGVDKNTREADEYEETISTAIKNNGSTDLTAPKSSIVAKYDYLRLDHIIIEISGSSGPTFDLSNIYFDALVNNEITEMTNKYDYIYAKYGASLELEDFLGRGQTSNVNKKVFQLSDIQNSTWIIAVVSIIGLTSVGAYFFYRKRKEE